MSKDPARDFVGYLTLGFVAFLVVIIAASVAGGFGTDGSEEEVNEPHGEQPSQEATATSDRDTLDIPEYRVADTVDQMVGGLYGEVIIPSLPVDVDTVHMKRIAFAIMEQEGFDEAAFYRTEEARRANISASFREEHPNALEEGLLGSVRKGEFTPSPYLYDQRFR